MNTAIEIIVFEAVEYLNKAVVLNKAPSFMIELPANIHQGKVNCQRQLAGKLAN